MRQRAKSGRTRARRRGTLDVGVSVRGKPGVRREHAIAIGLLCLAASACYRGADGRDVGEDTDGASEGGSAGDDDDGDAGDDGSAAGAPSGPMGLRLLTPTQYANSVTDVLGDVAVEAVGQWRSSIAAAQGGVSSAGVEDYEIAAHDVAAQVFGDPVLRMEVAGCTPAAVPGDACTASVIATLGRRAWRRPLAVEEVERYGLVASEVAALLEGDAWAGLQHAVAGLL